MRRGEFRAQGLRRLHVPFSACTHSALCYVPFYAGRYVACWWILSGVLHGACIKPKISNMNTASGRDCQAWWHIVAATSSFVCTCRERICMEDVITGQEFSRATNMPARWLVDQASSGAPVLMF